MTRDSSARPDPRLVRIYVDIVDGDKRLVVDQEPVHARTDGQGRKTIGFLIEDAANYEFESDGVRICLVPGTKACTVAQRAECTGGGPLLQCRYAPPAPRTVYLYELVVIEKATRQPIRLDPSIMN